MGPIFGRDCFWRDCFRRGPVIGGMFSWPGFVLWVWVYCSLKRGVFLGLSSQASVILWAWVIGVAILLPVILFPSLNKNSKAINPDAVPDGYGSRHLYATP